MFAFLLCDHIALSNSFETYFNYTLVQALYTVQPAEARLPITNLNKLRWSMVTKYITGTLS